MLAHLQRFKGFTLLFRRAYLKKHIQTANNESYNEEQGIESIIFWTSSFFTEPISFLACSTVRCYI